MARRTGGPVAALARALVGSYGHYGDEASARVARIRAEDVAKSLARAGFVISVAPPRRLAPPPEGDDTASVIASIRHHLAVIRISDDPELIAIADALTPVLDRLANPAS